MGTDKNIKLHIVTDIKVQLIDHQNPAKMSLVVPEKFQHILRVMNTNIDGKTKIMYAMTSIKGVGRRFSNICLKKADIDMNKRAGELSDEEVERLVTIMQNPRQYKIPDYFLNRPKDIKDGKHSSRRFGKIEEDQSTPWSSTLLGSASTWAAYNVNWSQRKNGWCLEEEVISFT